MELDGDPITLDDTALERLRRLGGDPFVGRMIDLFLENSVLRMDAAREGLRTGDLDTAGRAVHSLKSSAGNLGARRLQRTAAEMELLADGGDRDRLAALLPELEHAFEEARSRLRHERETLSP